MRWQRLRINRSVRLLTLMGMLVIRGRGGAGGHLLVVGMGLAGCSQGGRKAEHQPQQAELAESDQCRR